MIKLNISLLKDIYKLSDVDVVGRSLSGMAFKFFLV